MYAVVDYIGNQILIKEGEKVKIPFLDKKIGTRLFLKMFYSLMMEKEKKLAIRT